MKSPVPTGPAALRTRSAFVSVGHEVLPASKGTGATCLHSHSGRAGFFCRACLTDVVLLLLSETPLRSAVGREADVLDERAGLARGRACRAGGVVDVDVRRRRRGQRRDRRADAVSTGPACPRSRSRRCHPAVRGADRAGADGDEVRGPGVERRDDLHPVPAGSTERAGSEQMRTGAPRRPRR